MVRITDAGILIRLVAKGSFMHAIAKIWTNRPPFPFRWTLVNIKSYKQFKFRNW